MFPLADQVYLQDLPQLPHMPVSESPYASPSLYKCASDPSSNTDTDRPHMSPAQLAGVHVAQGSLGANPRDAAAMFTYSSEPTAMASSSMVHSAGARLSESQFHDIAWVRVSLYSLEHRQLNHWETSGAYLLGCEKASVRSPVDVRLHSCSSLVCCSRARIQFPVPY